MSDDERDVLCIRCPKGCRLKLKIGDEVIVKGHECELGEEYGKQEAEDPRRVVPTTVKIRHARWDRLPVRTKRGIPISKIGEFMEEIKETEVEAPVEKGEIIMKDIAGTSISLMAERDMERVEE